MMERTLSALGDVSIAPSSASPASVCALAFYDEWQVWQFLERYFKAQLPLRDITWRLSPSSTPPTISSLPIQILDHDHAIFKNLDAVNNYRAPFVHINFVVCESADAYKNTIKGKVKAWIDDRSERQEEWLLVYVPVGTQNNTHDMYMKIYSRLAADFCTKSSGDKSSMLAIFEGGLSGSMAGSTRMTTTNDPSSSVVQQQQQQQEQWTDLTAKLKAIIGQSYAARVKAYGEEVKKLEVDSRRSAANPPLSTRAPSSLSSISPSTATTAAAGGGEGDENLGSTGRSSAGGGEEWDFFALFFAKESLALMHEQLQLPAEALLHYQELNAMCIRYRSCLPILAPKALMVFQPTKSGLPTLDFPVFEFRIKLEGDEIGILEIQQYLFSREASFLQQLGRHADLIRRIHQFLTQQFHTLRQYISQLKIPSECAELWAFTSSWEVYTIAVDFQKMQVSQALASCPPLGPSSPKGELKRQEGKAELVTGSSPPTSTKEGIDMSTSTTTIKATPPSKLTITTTTSPTATSSTTDQVMSRYIAELLDFCRLRYLGLGQSLIKPEVLLHNSVICAARRELLTPVLPTSSATHNDKPSRSSSAASSGEKILKAEFLKALQGRAGGEGVFLGRADSIGGSEAITSSSFDDPRHVSVNLGVMLARHGWLYETFSSIKAFDEQYLRITEVLIHSLEKATRDRFVGRVQAERALALLKMNDYEEARRVLRTLVEGCFRRDYWIPLLSQLIRKLAVCEKERGSARSYVSAILQVLSLQCLNKAAGQYYLQEVDSYVRTKLTSRMLRSLSLLATARVNVAPTTVTGGGTSKGGSGKVELGSKASVTIWLNLNLKQPLTVDGLSLMLGELNDLRKRRRIGSEMGWIAASSCSGSSNAAGGESAIETPTTPKGGGGSTVSPRMSPVKQTLGGGSGGGEKEEPTTNAATSSSSTSTMTSDGNTSDLLTWRMKGPITLNPGVNELELSTALLPPPGTYVYEKLVLHWGALILEQDQITALDSDTLELVTKQRPPPRRFSALSRAPAKRGVPLTVVAKPPVASLALVSYPVLPPDALHVHHVSVLLETKTDTLTAPTLTLSQSPLVGLAAPGSALLAYFEEDNEAAAEQGKEKKVGEEAVPVREESVPITWDGAVASVALPQELPPHTCLVITLPLHPLPRVVEGFVRGRQDHQLNISIEVELSAELNKETFKAFYAQAAVATAAKLLRGSDSGGGDGNSSSSSIITSPSSPKSRSHQQPPSTPPSSNKVSSPRSSHPVSTSSNVWSSGILEEALERTCLTANVDVVIQQPFSVTISVQGCSHWKASRRYFVQALLRSRAPTAVTLHECRLKFPPSYREVLQPEQQAVGGGAARGGGGGGGGHAAHLKDLTLAPLQDVRYTYLIERLPSAASTTISSSGGGRASSPQVINREKENISKMSVMADYTWESPPSLLPKSQSVISKLRRHHPPQQQSFERYFQDSAMLNRGDHLRTFVIRAQLTPTTAAEEERGPSSSFSPTSPLLPPSAPATPGDVEERGVVVGHFQNRVTEGLVGVALRLELTIELSEEALKEAASASLLAAAADGGDSNDSRQRKRFCLAYEVTVDPADWAVSGLAKGTLELLPDQAPLALQCKVVPVRIGMLACPSLIFEPVDVRAAISPKSRQKSNVRWVGPRDIQVFPSRCKRLYPLNKS